MACFPACFPAAVPVQTPCLPATRTQCCRGRLLRCRTRPAPYCPIQRRSRPAGLRRATKRDRAIQRTPATVRSDLRTPAAPLGSGTYATYLGTKVITTSRCELALVGESHLDTTDVDASVLDPTFTSWLDRKSTRLNS